MHKNICLSDTLISYLKCIDFDNFNEGFEKIYNTHVFFISNINLEAKMLICGLHESLGNEDDIYEVEDFMKNNEFDFSELTKDKYKSLILIRDYYMSFDYDEFGNFCKFQDNILDLICKCEYYYYKNEIEIDFNINEKINEIMNTKEYEESGEDILKSYLLKLYTNLLE